MIKLRPYVLLNSAMTLDGKIATSNSGISISGKNDLERVHDLRKEFDAIMVGINTILIDDPRLTVHKIPSKKEDNPIRVVIDSNGRIPLDSRVLNDDAETILIVSRKAPKDKIRKLIDKCEIIEAGEYKVDLTIALEKLFKIGIKSVMLEGGSTLNFSMFEERLIDEVSICVGSKILGGKDSKTLVDGLGFDEDDCVNLELQSVEKIDTDVLLTYMVL